MKATGHISAERFYGDFVKIDNSRWRVYHPTGHVDITSQGVQTWMYYVRDRLGSTRAVITEQGVPLQVLRLTLRQKLSKVITICRAFASTIPSEAKSTSFATPTAQQRKSSSDSLIQCTMLNA